MTGNKAKYKLVLLRHGESEWNSKNLFCGWVDVCLTEKGRRQASDSARLLEKFELAPDVIFTSKLTRSCQTAEIIMDSMKIVWTDVIRSWRLNERHYGSLQGRKKADVLQEVGEETYRYWRRGFYGCPPFISSTSKYAAIDLRYKYSDVGMKQLPRGESLAMVVERVKPFYEADIKQQMNQGKTVLVAAHGSTVRALIKLISGISDDDIQDINIPNGIPLLYELDQDFRPVSEYKYLDPNGAIEGAKQVAGQGYENLGRARQ